MCGRFGLRFPDHPDPFALGLYPAAGTTPRYHIAPTQPVLVLHKRDGERQSAMMRWGLVPSWAKAPAAITNTINARAETVAEKFMYRAAFRARRCLIPADVFYEWQQVSGAKRKQPYAIHRRDDRPFFLAGVWEQWDGSEAANTNCAIITTTPNAVMAPIHHRMSVIVSAEGADAWLDSSDRGERATTFLRPCADDLLDAYPVSDWANSPAHDDARCVEAHA